MKKLVEGAVNNDNFTWLREDQMRAEVRALLKTKVFVQPFPRKTLLDMSLLELVSLWCLAAGSHDSKALDERKGEMDLVKWLHAAIGQLIVLHFTLDKLAKRTENVLPSGWENLPISDLISNGGRLNAQCETPEGTPGRMHTIPFLKVKVVVPVSGTPLWYETV